MLAKLQRKTIIPAQLIGYVLTLLIGATILLLAIQVFSDVRMLLTEQTDIFNKNAVAVSKNITVLNTLDKSDIYFTESELEELRNQDFISEVAEFKSATFSSRAIFNGGNLGNLATEMFFESINDKYVDVESDFWEWDSSSNFLPLIIPEDFLNLYNFCFAESQSLPVISKGAIELVSFNIEVEGNGKRKVYESRIVGFSNKIKTILVPESFLDWANANFGNSEELKSSRLLIDFENPNDESIPQIFNKHGYNINETELESSKMTFVFRLALLFVFAVAVVIILLSMAFIVMSLNLIIQKNRNMLVNLYNIGYSPSRISRYYQIVISAVTIIDVFLAIAGTLWIRNIYLTKLASVFSTYKTPLNVWINAAILLAILIIVYNITIRRNIRKAVMP